MENRLKRLQSLSAHDLQKPLLNILGVRDIVSGFIANLEFSGRYAVEQTPQFMC